MSDVFETVGPSSVVFVGDSTVLAVPESVITVIAAGAQGPVGGQGETGPTGPQGDQGIPGVAETYTFDQNMASDTWTITHNLGAYLPVTVIDSTGATVEGDIEYVSINQVVLSFAAPFGGTAYVG